MPSTYTLIQGETLAATAASYTFTGIPSTFTDLAVRMSVRTDDGGNSYFNLYVNGINTGTNYSSTGLRYNLSFGTGARSGNQSNATTWQYEVATGQSDGATANTFSNSEIYFPNYTATTPQPISAFYASENNSSTSLFAVGVGAGQNRGTSAISSITIANLGAVVFKINSSFYLYGIKKS